MLPGPVTTAGWSTPELVWMPTMNLCPLRDAVSEIR